ncbi:MAG: ABC transporter permease subunit [Acidobacteriota bacterium]
MGALSRAVAVFSKEFRDNLRDRRSVGSALLYSVFGPVLVALVMAALARSQELPSPLDIPVAGADGAPALMAHLERTGARIVPAPGDPEAAVRNGDVDLVLVVEDGHGEAFAAGRPAPVRLVHDTSRVATLPRLQQVHGWLFAYSGEVTRGRLVDRGVDPVVLEPLRLEAADQATPMARAARYLGSLPIFFLIAAFVGGMHVAIDVTAGERERGSLEALLVHAAPTQALALGKWATTVVFNVAAVALTLGVSVAVFRSGRFGELAAQVRFGAEEALWVLVILLPAALLVPALQMAVAMFSRSFKEAQTYLSLLIFLPTVPGLLLSLDTLEVAAWMHGVPILGQAIQVFDIVRGVPVSATQWAASAMGSLLGAALLVWLTGHFLRRERILLAR